MLDLDDSKWSELDHAYGAASDIPDLLRKLDPLHQSQDDKEPWFSLWSALAHQGDVYSASFAAVPHIVNTLLRSPETASRSYFQFPAWVEICRHKNRIKVQSDLSQAYNEALAKLPSLVTAASCHEWSEWFARCALSSFAVAKGNPLLAEALLELSPDVLVDFREWLDER